MIYWANDVYHIKIGGTEIIKFFPQKFYDVLHLPFRLAEGMAFHFVFMWLFTINGILYVVYTLFSGEWKLLWPKLHHFKEAWLVLLHDLRLRKKAPVFLKYNAAQRIAYSAIIVMGAGSVITGAAIFKPVQLGWLCSLLGGYEAARAEHFILTIGYCLFFLVHIVQVCKAGWNNFRAMITGFETVKEKTITSPEGQSSSSNRQNNP
jgi:thiosulfate reductase cytochrome b subunit